MELGWIDFSKSEKSKILSALELLLERGTLDDLGIAPIRDGFASLFFPWYIRYPGPCIMKFAIQGLRSVSQAMFGSNI